MSESIGNDCFTIEDSISTSFKIFEKFYDSNDIEEVIAQSEQRADNDIYHSALKSQFLIFKTCLTLDQVDIDKASESATKTVELCDQIRRRGLLQNLLKIIRTPDYNKYTELEMHAELTFAMIMAYSAVIGFLKCHSIVDLLRIINRLRLSKNSYKECRLMYKNRTHWESEISRANFEAGIRLERGFRHLIISFFPPKFLSIVNFMGYKGVRNIGFSELNKSAFESTGIYSKIAEFLLLGYYTFVEAIGSVGKKQLNICNAIIKKGLERHPNFIAYKIFKAKSAQMNGEIERAIIEFEQLLITDKTIFHKFSHWELLWSYALKCDWDQCIKYSELLRRLTIHSPAITTYSEAAFRYFKSYENNDKKLKEEATELFRIVPSLRIRYIGKTITFEKACIEYTKRYFDNDEFLFLPVLDMLYNANMFHLIDGNIPLLEKHLYYVEKEMKSYLKDLDTIFYIDYYLDTLFFKGVILKHMGRFAEAQHCLTAVIKEKDRIEDFKSIIAESLMELGLIQMLSHNYEEAIVFLNKALKDYSGYLTENLVHIRIHSALREMGVNTDNVDKSETIITEEYFDRSSETHVPQNNNSITEVMRL